MPPSPSTLVDKHVGILALEVYTPRTFIRQDELEEHTGVAAGKYTIGLGQEGLAVTGDAEDINSLCLTAVHSLLEKYNIDPSQVGRLEVGTETLVDKSKSTKTVLMDLFPGNTDMEGATVINACYGGTAALLNAFLWCESDGWDGRYAIVVAADIAAYDKGPARPTCGAGAVAVLVGRDAPLAFNPHHRATHAANVWDFFKPDHTVEYPTVDGALSQVCYYQALEDVYERFCQKMTRNDGMFYDATTPNYLVFHSPYNKLVQKSYARLFLLDARRRRQQLEQQAANGGAANEVDVEEKKTDPPLENGATACNNAHVAASMATSSVNKNTFVPEYDQLLEEWLTKPIEETYADKNLEKVLKNISKPFLAQKMGDSNFASVQVGNTYTASVFLGLASLVDRADLKSDQSIVMFSYGSGALATMYGLTVRDPATQCKFTIERIKSALDLTNRLAQREKIHPAELDRALNTRARMHHVGAPYTTVYPKEGRLYPGTYYLVGIDEKWRRTYARVSTDAPLVKAGTPLAPPSVLTLEDAETAPEGERKGRVENDSGVHPVSSTACLITGTAAGLPGSEHVFRSDNVDRLLAGEQCIQPVSEAVKKAMVDKNIVQQRRKPDKTTERISLEKESDMIQLSAQLGTFDMTKSYGVHEGLAKTMDLAAQVAVAAGMEALKNAGLVRGKSNDPNEWKLPEQYRDSTGVVYASSFPAMDAAIGEVIRCFSSKTLGAADTMRLVAALRDRLVQASPDGELSDEDEAAFARLLVRARSVESSSAKKSQHYEFDRKFLFRVLVLGNAQLAQLAGCRGPNTQTNAACAGTTQAIAMAQDMLVSGRAKRVVVIAGDNASGDTLMPWLGTGFHVLGAATTKSTVEEAALPFDKRRSGMLLGAGGIGLVLETEESAAERQQASCSSPFKPKARLLATQYSNSAFHGAALDRHHIGRELVRFLADIEMRYSISKAEIAEHGVYFSHETCTHASDASSCAGNEVAALRHAFGDDLLAKLLILNTKGFTGHPMGVSFEDIAAVEVLNHQIVPAVPNHKVSDDYLGKLNLSQGGPYPCRYALRFAAGFGSQVAFALYATCD